MAQQELIASNDELEAVNYQIKLANDELERMSLTDKLTGTWNRRHFEKEAASSAMEMAEKLRHLVATHDFPGVGEVTVSIGVAEHSRAQVLMFF